MTMPVLAPFIPGDHLIAVATREAFYQSLCEKHLREAGFSVMLCHDGASVVETVETHSPHLLIIDDDMEWTEGIPAVLRLHADPAFAALPVLIMVRRVNDPPAWVWHDNYPGNFYLSRPFPPEELRAFVNRILQLVIAGKLPPFPPTTPSFTLPVEHWQVWSKQLPPFALFDAAWHDDQAAAERLMAQGADVRARDRRGWTALHSAAGGGSASLVRWLLRQGAEVNVATREGMTLLLVAAASARVAVMRVLLEGGAEPNAVTDEGETALLRLLKYRGGTQAYVKQQEESVALLLAFGADPNLRNAQGETALGRAHQHALTAIEQCLLHWGAQAS